MENSTDSIMLHQAVIGAIGLLGGIATGPKRTNLADCLKIEDVERISGRRKISQANFSPEEFLGSDLNFVSEEGAKLLSVEFSFPQRFDTYRSLSPKNLMLDLLGIGEAAFVEYADDRKTAKLLVFRTTRVTVSLFTAADAQNGLSLDQLIAIGRLIGSRIK